MPTGTIADAGKAQVLVSPTVARKGLSVQNNSDGDLRLLQGGQDASSTMGIRISAGAYYETPVNRFSAGSWSIWGATAGQAFGWEEW